MINAAHNEKAKEIKKTSEADSYETFGDEEMENAEEDLEATEISIPESDTAFHPSHTTRSVSISPSELLEQQSIISEDERKRRNLKEKYLNAVGRRPKTIPEVSVYPLEQERRTLFFGERRPRQVDKQRKEKWKEAIKRMKPLGNNYGRVIRDVRLVALNQGLNCIRFEPRADSLATGHRNGRVEVRNVITGQAFITLYTLESEYKIPVRALRYHPDDGRKLYVGGATGIVQVFDIESPNSIADSENVEQINVSDISIDGNNLVIGGRTSKITVMDPYTLQVKSIKQRPNIDENTHSNIDDEYHSQRIYCMKCHGDDANVFLTGSWDGTVKIWDFRVPGAVLSIRGPWIDGEAVDVLGNVILTGSWRPEKAIQLWDFSSGKQIKNVPVMPKTTKFEGEFLYNAKFFRDTFGNNSVRNGLIAVSGSGFYEVSVLDVNTEQVIAYFPSHKGIFCMDLVGNLVAYGGRESFVRIGELLLAKDDFYET